jgi:hypothetical protein
MHNMKKMTLGVGALSVMMATGAALSAVNAAEIDQQERPHDAEHTAVREALENNDYTAWSAAMTDLNQKRFDGTNENISEDTFATLQEMKEAKENGDYEKLKELRTEIGPGFGMGRKGKGMGRHHREKNEAAHEARENGDRETARELKKELRAEDDMPVEEEVPVTE